MDKSSNFSRLMQQLRAQLPYLKEKHHVATIQVFGSYVRGEQTSTSDLDLLVTFPETPSLLEFIALENYLSDTLEVKVDLIMKNSLKEPLQDIILEEAVIEKILEDESQSKTQSFCSGRRSTCDRFRSGRGPVF